MAPDAGTLGIDCIVLLKMYSGYGSKASGNCSEGLEMCEQRLDFFKDSCELDCLKIIEVWQGHLNNGEKFITELQRLAQ